MHAKETQLKTLLVGEKQYHVPLFQRRYTWGPEEHGQIWRDIVVQYEALAAAQQEGRLASFTGSHFIGSFVLAPTNTGASSVARFLVVDGQQRLTTLTLALCALRDAWAEIDHEGASKAVEEISELYLINKFRSGEERYKLLPTQNDRAAYFSIVDGTTCAAAGSSLVEDAYRFFLAKISETTAAEEEDSVELERLKTVLVSQLSVVDITADPDDNVHRIFESLNATGVELDQGDLLRNYIFMLLPTSSRAERIYHELWEPIEESIGVKNIEQLARLDLMRRGIEVLSDDVYRSQRERFRPYEGDEDAVEAEVRDFSRQARFFSRILVPATEPDSRIRRHLEFFARWGAQTVYPVVMYAYDRCDRGLATADEMAELLLNLESFLVRRLLIGVRSGNLNRIFLRVVKKLVEDADRSMVEVARWELSGERQYWGTDAQIRKAARSFPFYYYGRAEQKRMILETIERSTGHKESSDLASMPLSIEHVMPQTMTEEWRQHLAEQGDDPDEVHGALLHTLGNLTLTGYNTPLSNKPLERKQDIYKKSLLAMNQPIAEAEHWGKASIEARADALADIIIGAWPAPEPRAETEATEFWAPLHDACAVIPPGSWTSYGEAARLLGTSAIAVGAYIGKNPIVNAYRVMRTSGEVAAGFHWEDGDDTRDVRELLVAEGIEFDERGRASQDRFLSAEELREMMVNVLGEE